MAAARRDEPARADAAQRLAGGITRLPHALDVALDDVRGAGFDAVRIFLHWDKIETTEDAPNCTCKYLTIADLGPDSDRDGSPDLRPGIPCDGTPCGCGYSADERVTMAVRDPERLPVLLTIVGTPRWARGRPAPDCPADAPGRALPLRRGKESAFHEFVAAVARRYGTIAYAFELWNEPDLEACVAWAGTQQQYKEQILSAATAVKSAGIAPGLVVAPTLENPSGAAMDAWMDWSQPVDVLSFNLYTTDVVAAVAKIDEMNAWCGANRRCPGFYITEFGARRTGVSNCPGPRTDRPGAGDVAIMKRCRKRRRCAGFFLFALSARTRARSAIAGSSTRVAGASVGYARSRGGSSGSRRCRSRAPGAARRRTQLPGPGAHAPLRPGVRSPVRWEPKAKRPRQCRVGTNSSSGSGSWTCYDGPRLPNAAPERQAGLRLISLSRPGLEPGSSRYLRLARRRPRPQRCCRRPARHALLGPLTEGGGWL